MAKGGFPNMGGANMNNLMKQAQKLQQDMEKMQGEMEKKEILSYSWRRSSYSRC